MQSQLRLQWLPKARIPKPGPPLGAALKPASEAATGLQTGFHGKLLMSKHLQGFSGGSVVKNLPANARDSGLIPGPERSPGEGNGNPLPYSCLENPHGERSLVGYSPWAR